MSEIDSNDRGEADAGKNWSQRSFLIDEEDLKITCFY